MRARPHLVAAGLALALAAGPARAAPRIPPPPPRPWSLALGAGTDFPVSLSVRADLTAPWRLRLSSSLGVLPGAYVDAINAAVVSMGGYDEDTADLVRSALRRSLVWRTHAGARIWRGIHAEVGWGVVTLGGEAASGDLLSVVTGQTLPVGVGEDRRFAVDATLHQLDVEVGWTQELPGRLSLRVALGGAFTLAARVRVDPDYRPLSQAAAERFARDAEVYLEDTFTRYVHAPVVGVSLAYRVF